MLIEYRVALLAEALKLPEDERGKAWIKGRCNDSSAIHEAVWHESAAHDYVEGVVLPLLESAREQVLATSLRGCKGFAKNIADRIKNIRNRYLQGKRSTYGSRRKASETQAESFDALLAETRSRYAELSR